MGSMSGLAVQHMEGVGLSIWRHYEGLGIHVVGVEVFDCGNALGILFEEPRAAFRTSCRDTYNAVADIDCQRRSQAKVVASC